MARLGGKGGGGGGPCVAAGLVDRAESDMVYDSFEPGGRPLQA